MWEEHIIALLGIVNKIVNTGHRVLAKHTIPSGLLLEMEFPVSPFNAEDVVSHIDDKTIPTGFAFPPQ